MLGFALTMASLPASADVEVVTTPKATPIECQVAHELAGYLYRMRPPVRSEAVLPPKSVLLLCPGVEFLVPARYATA